MATDTRNHPARSLKGWGVACRTGLLALALVGLTRAPLRADDTSPLEYQVKAAFLVKFALFVEWPTNQTASATNASLFIGLLGNEPFGKNFDAAVKAEKINYRPVRLRRGNELSELEDCQVIFFCASESERLELLLARLDGKPVLTVSDEPGFARRGGMVGFIKEGGKVRFEINLAAAARSGLKLSAKLLQVAKIVEPAPTLGE